MIYIRLLYITEEVPVVFNRYDWGHEPVMFTG